jgi:hypothetical protein
VDAGLADLGIIDPLDAEDRQAVAALQEDEAALVQDTVDIGAEQLRPERGDTRCIVRVDRDVEEARIPIMNFPPVSWLRVPPLIAKATGVRYMTGDTPIPVLRPSGATSRLAAQRCAQSWKES